VASERATRAAAAPAGETPASIADALTAVLRDHTPATPQGTVMADGRARPPATTAACVHGDSYGTRSALIVTVGAAGPPLVRVADGPPCQAPLRDVTALWSGPALV
jgi:hypothetical protein